MPHFHDLTIYDIGANRGENIPYYLLKAPKVVAVEANPKLADLLRSRFKTEVDEGRLVVENCAVVGGRLTQDVIPFYVHKIHDVWATAIRPDNLDDFQTICVPCKAISEIIHVHGLPQYVKIDIEGLDAIVLRDLFDANIYPPFVSAESHNIEVFCILVDSGKYNSFKLVDGQSVSHVYRKHLIYSSFDLSHRFFSFPADSAGPFGGDIKGEWMVANHFFRKLAFSGLGWKDIHACNVIEASPEVRAEIGQFLGLLLSPSDIPDLLLIIPKNLANMLNSAFAKVCSRIKKKLCSAR